MPVRRIGSETVGRQLAQRSMNVLTASSEKCVFIEKAERISRAFTVQKKLLVLTQRIQRKGQWGKQSLMGLNLRVEKKTFDAQASNVLITN